MSGFETGKPLWMEITFALCLPRDELSVPAVRHLTGRALRELGVDDSCVSDIELAVTEACTNVLRHAAADQTEYEVRIKVDENECEVSVADAGDFDPVALHEVAPPLAEGGRGVRLMRALVDKLSFEPDKEGRTVVSLTKSLSFDGDSAVALMAARGELPLPK